MSKKEDLKLVFDFIADFLRDEKSVEVKPVVEDVKQKTKKSKSDENLEHMLEIMKRVDARDKVRKTAPVIPPTERDEDVVVSRIQEVMSRPKTKNEPTRDMSHLKTILNDSKVFNDLLSVTHPIVDSSEKLGEDLLDHG
jgi:hypothetical protein